MLTRSEEVGLSSKQLANIQDHIERQYLVTGKLPGALTLVARHGKVVYCHPQGMMDQERKKRVQEDTIFRLYSMTKPITSVAMMMLYEKGYFQLTDPVVKFIPEWKALQVYVAGNEPNFVTKPLSQPMTIRHLMTHTSGLTYGFMERTNVDRAYRKLNVAGVEDGYTTKELINRLAQLPLEFSPGSAWNYSQATDVLGYIIEILSGQSLDEFLQENILQPLNMKDTAFSVPPNKQERFAACYYHHPKANIVLQDDPANSRYCRPITYFSGGDGLVSTAIDYWRFCQMLLNGGELEGVRLLGPRTIDFMTTNHLPGGKDLATLSTGAFSEIAYEGTGFGLGFAVKNKVINPRTMGSPGEYSWGGLASTAFWVDPKEAMVVIFMSQLIPSNIHNIRSELHALIYPALLD